MSHVANESAIQDNIPQKVHGLTVRVEPWFTLLLLVQGSVTTLAAGQLAHTPHMLVGNMVQDSHPGLLINSHIWF